MVSTPLTWRVFQRPGSTLHYRFRPSHSGRVIVFLHGAGMDGRMFDAQLAALPDGDGVVCWDARGHGRSTLEGAFRFDDMVADLDALVTSIDAHRVILVGQSMGGNLAQTYVNRHPERVAGLVLIDCTANHAPLSRLDLLGLRSTRAVLTFYPWQLAVKQSARACGRDPRTAAYAADCLRRIGKRRFIEVMDFWREALRPDATYRMPVPTLALLGDKDRSGNIAKALPLLAASDPSVQLVTIPDAAHNSNMDQPATTNRALLSFLQDGHVPV